MKQPVRLPFALAALIAVQTVSVIVFLSDVGGDLRAQVGNGGLDWHSGIEALAVVVLALAIVVEIQVLLRMLRRGAHLERQARVAAGAFYEVMAENFDHWGLTPSEQDIATFVVKGFSITEIAGLRGSAEGTVKSHLNAIYRKAGVANRGALLGLLIEDLVTGPQAPDRTPAPESAPDNSALS